MQNESLILKVTPRSSLYKGSYITKVLSEGERAWVISMPEVKGRFIPLPVGTILEVEFVNVKRPPFQAEVLNRSFGSGRNLTISAPGTVSRGGRDTKSKHCRVIAFSSGKGGVGKSTIIINVALALNFLGNRCCIIDVDLGTANVDTLLKVNAPYNLHHLVEGEKNIEEIIVKGPEGLLLVPGGSGLDKLANLKEWHFSRLISAFNRLEDMADYLLLDTGAGVSRNVTNFLLAADEIVLIATPEPHAIMDVYALIKVLANYEIKSSIKLIVNKIEKEEEALHVWNTISAASRHFLNIPVENLGYIPYSKAIALSVKKQEPFFLTSPKSNVTENILKISEMLAGSPKEIGIEKEKGHLPFIHRLKKIILGT